MNRTHGIRALAAGVIVAGGGATAGAAGTNLLTNPGFENPGIAFVFDAWQNFGANVFPSGVPPLQLDPVIEGAVSCKIFGAFNGGIQNDTVVIQEVPVTAGQLYEFQMSALHVTGDLLAPNPLNPLTSRAFAIHVLEYKDSLGNVIQQNVQIAIDETTTPDIPNVVTVQTPAPVGAVTLNYVLVFIQIQDGLGAAYFDTSSICDIGTFDFTQPWNLSFENGIVGQFPPGWALLGTNASQNGDADPARTGTRSLIMFGNFPGDGSLNDTLAISNPFPVTPGDTVDAEAWAYSNSSDPIAVDNLAFMNIDWLDATSTLIGSDGVFGLDSTGPFDTHVQVLNSAIAPPGAASAQITLGYQQVNEGAGAVFWDDVSFTVTPGSTACDGDANGDGTVDVGDISYAIFRLGTCVAGGTPCANGCDGDANGDGAVDVGDISYVIFRLGTCNPQGFVCP